jgi:hypothetical protein
VPVVPFGKGREGPRRERVVMFGVSHIGRSETTLNKTVGKRRVEVFSS